MIAIVFQRVADRLLVADPGLARFVTALRATLATLLTAAVGIHIALRHGATPLAAGLGVLFSMIAPLFLRDHTLRDWLLSLFAMYAVAVLSFTSAALLDAQPLIADAVFVGLLFTGILIQACGPRALGCALAGLVAFYLGVYSHPSLSALGLSLVLSMSAPLVIVAVARWIVPQRRSAALRLAIRTVTLRARQVVLASRKHAALSSMNEAAIAFEERLALIEAGGAAALREALVELEVAAGQYTFDEANRPIRESAFRRAIDRLESIDTAVAHRELLSARMNWTAAFNRVRASLSWLPATRAGTAALLAVAAGHALSSERWFWAVITTFVVFLGTRSRGDTFYRAAQRIVGTLAGGAVSVLLLNFLHGNALAICVAMLLCVFGWAFFIMSAYAPGVFFITVLVGLVYGALGHPVQALVELRIGEVAIGCLACLIAAFTVKPLATTRHIEARFIGVVDALIDGVSVAASSDESRAATAIRALDRQWHDFRIALRPQRVFIWEPRYEQVAGALLCCVHHVRALLCDRGNADADMKSFDAVIARLGAVRARVLHVPADSFVPVDAAADSTLVALDGAIALLASRIGNPSGGHALSMTREKPWPVARLFAKP